MNANVFCQLSSLNDLESELFDYWDFSQIFRFEIDFENIKIHKNSRRLPTDDEKLELTRVS